MKKIILFSIIILTILLFTVKVPAQVSPVSNLDQKNTPIINTNMMYLQNSISSISGIFTTIQGYFTNGILKTSAGGTSADLSACSKGSISYFSSTGVQSCLSPSATGDTLTTNGSGYNPSWSPNTGVPYSSGTLLETFSMSIATSGFSATPQKVKELSPMLRSGVVSVSFDYASNQVAGTNARIYINGSAVGTNQASSSTAFATFTEDITVAKGDVLQLYINGNGSNTDAVVCNMKVLVSNPTIPINSSDLPGKSYRGTGIPTPTDAGVLGVITQMGDQGDIYERIDGSALTTLYVKTGSSTWTAK